MKIFWTNHLNLQERESLWNDSEGRVRFFSTQSRYTVEHAHLYTNILQQCVCVYSQEMLCCKRNNAVCTVLCRVAKILVHWNLFFPVACVQSNSQTYIHTNIRDFRIIIINTRSNITVPFNFLFFVLEYS